MGIRIDELPPQPSPTADHALPSMKDGLPYQLLVSQIIELARVVIKGEILGGAPGQLDTLDELAAALNDDANYAATITAALAVHTAAINTINTVDLPGKQPLDAMLTALAALTSANGKFLAFTGADTPVVRDIKGTVSQTGGVPTGAIMERGTNVNGSYVAFADGTLICHYGVTTLALTGSVDYSTTWTFPRAFVDTTHVFTAIQYNPASTQSYQMLKASIAASGATYADVLLLSTASQNYRVGYFAIGRWYN